MDATSCTRKEIRCSRFNFWDISPLALRLPDDQESSGAEMAQLMRVGGLMPFPEGLDGGLCPYRTSTQLVPFHGG